MDLLLEPYRKYAVFDGRARRSEFWLFQLSKALLLIGLLLFTGLIAGAFGARDNSGVSFAAGLLWLLVVFALIIPNVAVSFRRLHDINRSGGWLLIGVVPLIGALVLFVMFLLPGTNGRNSYGDDPKQQSAPGPAVSEVFS